MFCRFQWTVFAQLLSDLSLRVVKRSKRRDITTVASEVQRVIRNGNEYIYTSKLDNLEEMDAFLKTYNLPRLISWRKRKSDTPINNLEIESVIRNLPTKKSPGTDSFTGEF